MDVSSTHFRLASLTLTRSWPSILLTIRTLSLSMHAESVCSRCLHVDDTGRGNAKRAKTDNFIGAIMLLLEHDVITRVVRMRK